MFSFSDQLLSSNWNIEREAQANVMRQSSSNMPRSPVQK